VKRFAPLAFALSLLAAIPAGAQTKLPPAEEVPSLSKLVSEGKLPPVAKRLPETPRVVTFEEGTQPGAYGGTMRMLMASSKDTRQMVVYGYTRLVVWTPQYTLEPDVLESYEVQDGRSFTLHLRKGHKWSDGAPFTAEDFRYYWEDVALNKELSPFGPPSQLLSDGELPKFQVINETTVRYSWPKPNPFFLPALASTTPLYIYRPAKYLKQFHAGHSDPSHLARRAKEQGMQGWAALHNRMDNQYRNDNPALPTLDPWILKTSPPSERFLFTRNPYFHRVDPQGRQLPYIDEVVMNVADGKIIPAKTGAGESDLQARYIRFDNYTFLKESEKRVDQSVLLWRTAVGSQFTLYPNLNVNDPGWRALFRDARFRRALSLAIDRHEVNQVIYYGLAIESANTVLPESPLYKPEYQKAWSEFDLNQANALLDELGMTKRNSRGVRLLPDGRPLELVVETAGESSEQADILELIRDTWQKAGIRLLIKTSQREVFRNRVFSGDTMMSVWTGLENGLPTQDLSPEELAPTNQQQLQWPKWGQYFETRGKAGEAPDMESAKRLLEFNQQWRTATNEAEKLDAWTHMLEIHANEVFTIGVVAGALQPVVASNRLRNVPVKGVYAWEPGAHFGIYKPDTFWLGEPRKLVRTQAMK
jgi:peptide/nickel transport system substrate-binding protein